jgi:acyl carrier protein
VTANRQAALEVIARVSGTAAADLRPEQHLVADLGVASPQALQLLVELEEKLGVEISDEEAAAMETVGDILSYAERV